MRVLRTGVLLILLSVLLVLAGGAIGGQSGLKIALGIAVVMNGISYFFSDKIALASSGAQRVSREQVPRLYEVMERLAGKARLPMPKLYVIPEPAPNAFATGRNPQHASVAVTEGLLELMNDEELEGVIAHELSHVRNYDILTSSIAATIAGAINSASLFFGVLTRLLTGVATMWVSGYCLSNWNALSGVVVSHASRSSFVRIAGMRCLTL